MKKFFALLLIVIVAGAVFACAAKEVNPELRPSQKLMQARAAWLTAMNKNLGAGHFDAIAQDAEMLSAESGKAVEKHPNPLGKELTLAISSLAKDVSAAAVKKDGDTVKIKLGEIKSKCGECHVKIRDKK